MLTYFEKEMNIEAGKRLRDARRKIGLSQLGLAAKLGITNDRISRYEAGSVLVPAWVLIVVEREALKCNITSNTK